MSEAPEITASPEVLRSLAAFLGRVLLRELESEQLDQLREGEVGAALLGLGVELPARFEQDDWLDERAAEYHELFLRPEPGPLVQSLWTQGRYEGDAAVRVRELAELADVEYQREAARGAAVDHLGSLLLLWSSTVDRSPAVADEIARAHLAWAGRPLQRIRAGGGFYGAIASATLTLLPLIAAGAAGAS